MDYTRRTAPEYAQTLDAAGAASLPPPASTLPGPPPPSSGIGGVCRCLDCCCKPGQGHRHPEFAAYMRYHRALESGLSDYEAREEGWPSPSEPAAEVHATPHAPPCVLR